MSDYNTERLDNMLVFQRFWALMINPWVIVAYMSLITATFLYVDIPLAYYFHRLDLGYYLSVLNLITHLGVGALYFVSLSIIALYYRYIKSYTLAEERAWFLLLCTLLPSLICLVMKILLGRARPSLLFDNNLYGFYGLHAQASFWSCPSGHTTVVMGFFAGLSVIYPRHMAKFLTIGLFIAATRVMLTNHYLSDVLVASYLACIEIGLLTWWLRKNNLLLGIYMPSKSVVSDQAINDPLI
ncbi:MAG: phosphatase PAP2 family protein [Legionella sp.]